jgi:hypothetical protein
VEIRKSEVFFVVTGRMIDQRSIDIFTGRKILFKSSVVFVSSLCLTDFAVYIRAHGGVQALDDEDDE